MRKHVTGASENLEWKETKSEAKACWPTEGQEGALKRGSKEVCSEQVLSLLGLTEVANTAVREQSLQLMFLQF